MTSKYIAMLDAKSRGHLLGGWVLREVVRQFPTIIGFRYLYRHQT